MAGFPPGLVWIASYPKSGNTWMRVLLTNLLANREQPVDINKLLQGDTLVGRWRFGDDMLVDADLLHAGELEMLRAAQCDFFAADLTTPFLCKTHDQFLGYNGKPVLGTTARAAVYMVRDPRDIAISLSHHAGLSVDDAIAHMSDGAVFSGGGILLPYLLGDWANHVSGWLEQSFVPTIVVRYEDMRRDAVAVLTEVISFLGGHASDAEIRRAVANSRLEELQRQESANGFRERQPKQKQFFRSGRVGEWQDVLTSPQIRRIEERFATVMIRWGYTPADR
jgi:hypothetical protein